MPLAGLAAISFAFANAGCLDVASEPDSDSRAQALTESTAEIGHPRFPWMKPHRRDLVTGQLTTDTSAAAALCFGPYALEARSNGQFVSAEVSYPGSEFGMLRARTDAIGPWEKFDECSDAGFGETRLFSYGTGLYVATEVEYAGNHNGMLRARANAIGSWEKYSVENGTDWEGSYITLRSMGNNRFVTADPGFPDRYRGMLLARGSSVGPWEKFVEWPL